MIIGLTITTRGYGAIVRDLLKGFASIFDHGHGRGPEADMAAIASDWAIVGDDMRQAIKQYPLPQ